MNVEFQEPFNQGRARLFESMTEFVLTKLAPNTHRRITVIFEHERGFMRDTGMMASAVPEWDGHTYTITLDPSLSTRQALLAVAHELVHVKQFDSMTPSELKEAMKPSRGSMEDYFDDPAEIEAYGRELGLFVCWCRKHGHDRRYSWARSA